jgi:uncharacterized protein (DUF1684 family)
VSRDQPSPSATLELTDWRRRVGELYGEVRAIGGTRAAWEHWRQAKQSLYREHPQSPVPADRRAEYVFACFDHDPALRVTAELVDTPARHIDGDGEVPGMTHVGDLRFTLRGAEHRLGAYWLDGYAGGLFVPCADATSGGETYGGGRYVLDTAKGADLGSEDGGVVLDFNYSYAPSCAHDPRWRCPLAPANNRLAVPVRGGELRA